MADDGEKKSSTATEDLMLTLFGLLILANAFQQLPILLQDKLGIDIGAPFLVASAGLTADTPLGTKVSAVNGGSFYSTPGTRGGAAGEFAPGASLVLTGGPETMAGARWWFVEDPVTGMSGWVPETMLVREGAGGLGPMTQLGSKARALLDTSAWRLPGSSDVVGALAKGAFGIITDGPRKEKGTRWWFFDADDSDIDGWLPESALVLASDTSWTAGSQVRATRDIDLFERAGGGQVLGSALKGEEMKIMSGPMLIGGEYWWLVETADGTQGWVPESALEDGGIRGWIKGAVTLFVAVAVIITTLLVGGIVYAGIRTSQIRAREAKHMREALPKTMEPKRNERLDKVLEHVASDNPNDWRLAIIECDIMLDELVMRMGYFGTTLGDKLKQVNRGDFRTVDAAWEAHRVRNQIAHQGSDFILTQREAKRVIALYESVFDEFKYS